MKYIVQIQSSIIIDAKTREEAAIEVENALEDARKRNCGNVDDEILASATIAGIGNRRIRALSIPGSATSTDHKEGRRYPGLKCNSAHAQPPRSVV